MLKSPIYLDYNSTTPVDSRVIKKMVDYMSGKFGNPGSGVTYSYGIEAEAGVEEAKRQISGLINCLPKEIIFTSGATESINLAILGTIKKNTCQKHKIAVLPIEHKAVLSVCEYLEKSGISETIFLNINSNGNLDLNHLEMVCSQGLSLLCIMAVNNEIGNIYPTAKVGKIAEKYNIPFLCDATQAIGRLDVDFEEWKTTFLALSAHKIYGTKGCGALILKKDFNIEPIMFGGGQQKGVRPGTLNVPGIVGLGEACFLRKLEMEKDEYEIKKKRDKLLLLLRYDFPELIINGNENSRIAGNLNISFPGIPNDILVSRLKEKVAISTGSACTEGIEVQSYVLKAMNLSQNILESSIRICVGKFTTDQEIYDAANYILKEIKNIKDIL